MPVVAEEDVRVPVGTDDLLMLPEGRPPHTLAGHPPRPPSFLHVHSGTVPQSRWGGDGLPALPPLLTMNQEKLGPASSRFLV